MSNDAETPSTQSSGDTGTPQELTWGQALLTALQTLVTTVVAAAASLGFVAFVGGAVLWTRFWKVGLPPDQVVAAVPRAELITIGASVLAGAVVLGLIAVAAAYVIDRGGSPSAGTRLSLLLLTGTGIWIVLLNADLSNGEQAGAAFIVVLVVLACALSPVEPAPAAEAAEAERPLVRFSSLGTPLLLLVGRRPAAPAPPPPPSPPPPRPVQLTAAGKAIQLAAVVIGGFVLWWVVGDDPRVLIGYALASGLYLCVLGIAQASSGFGPYAAALFGAVVVFCGGLAVLRAASTGEIQPAAALRTGEAAPVCGVYVTETSDRFYLGRLDAARKTHQPVKNGDAGQLFWVERKDMVGWAVSGLDKRENAEVVLGTLAQQLLEERRARVEETLETEVPAPTPAAEGEDTNAADEADSKGDPEPETKRKRKETLVPAREDSPACTLYATEVQG